MWLVETYKGKCFAVRVSVGIRGKVLWLDLFGYQFKASLNKHQTAESFLCAFKLSRLARPIFLMRFVPLSANKKVLAN